MGVPINKGTPIKTIKKSVQYGDRAKNFFHQKNKKKKQEKRQGMVIHHLP